MYQFFEKTLFSCIFGSHLEFLSLMKKCSHLRNCVRQSNFDEFLVERVYAESSASFSGNHSPVIFAASLKFYVRQENTLISNIARYSDFGQLTVVNKWATLFYQCKNNSCFCPFLGI